MSRKAAIILAGGKGERFQNKRESWEDKALAVLFGKPLLVHVVEKVQGLVDEIVVCVNDEKRKAGYQQVLQKYGVFSASLVVDDKIDHLAGPLVAILTGLKSVQADYCFALPSDMPLMKPKVVEYMFSKVKDSGVVIPIWPNGRLETLSVVVERLSALKIAETLCLLLRPRSDDLVRGASNVTFLSIAGEFSSFDPKLESFVNINSREDLAHLKPRRVEGFTPRSLHVNRGSFPTEELSLLQKASILSGEKKFDKAASLFSKCADRLETEKLFFWAAISRENEGKSLIKMEKHQEKFEVELCLRGKRAFLNAAHFYGLEAEMHSECDCIFLAERAKSDQAWCKVRAKEII